MQYHFSTVGDAMYAPCARSSLAKVCSTRFSLDVTFFALSFGTVEPQFVHWIVPDDPFPPFLRPLLARLSVMKIIQSASLYSCMIEISALSSQTNYEFY
jgi:hypothetical protein